MALTVIWEQLRLGISPPGFHQLLRDLGGSAGRKHLLRVLQERQFERVGVAASLPPLSS
jgi:hypothetical protein